MVADPIPRYKSFVCQQDAHLFTVLRYVERNAKTANLVKQAENWQWSSVWRRQFGTVEQQKLLSAWPITIPKDYLTVLNRPITVAEEEKLERSEKKSIPFGDDFWTNSVVQKYDIAQVLRGVGRPKNGG